MISEVRMPITSVADVVQYGNGTDAFNFAMDHDLTEDDLRQVQQVVIERGSINDIMDFSRSVIGADVDALKLAALLKNEVHANNGPDWMAELEILSKQIRNASPLRSRALVKGKMGDTMIVDTE